MAFGLRFPGIYRIRNCLNGKVYIGSSCSVRQRFNEHLSQLRRGKHFNAHLQRAWNKYGADSFVFEPLCYLEDDAKLLVEFEQAALDTYPKAQRYNKGDFAVPARGVVWSAESRAKQRLNRLGKLPSVETRQRMADSQRGRRHRPETLVKMKQRSPWTKSYRVTKPDGSQVVLAGTNDVADLVGVIRSSIQHAIKNGTVTNGHRVEVL